MESLGRRLSVRSRIGSQARDQRRTTMPPVIVGAFLVIHGLITTMIGAGAVSNGSAIALPAWFSWWPGQFGRSWLIDGLHLGAPAAVAGGLVWLGSGILLIAAGLGFLGVGPLRDAWAAVCRCRLDSRVDRRSHLHPPALSGGRGHQRRRDRSRVGASRNEPAGAVRGAARDRRPPSARSSVLVVHEGPDARAARRTPNTDQSECE